METIISGISAFLFHRIPPCVLALCRNEVDLSTPAGRRALGRGGAFLSYLDVPLDVLVLDREARHRSRGMRPQLWSGELPRGACRDIDAYHAVTSPAFSALLWAREVGFNQLVMMLYEITGSFSVIHLLPEHRMQVQAMLEAGQLTGGDGWRPVLDRQGRITDLWSRPPLATFDEIFALAKRLSGVRGSRAVLRALREVHGCAASPLEVQAVMRLCGSRSRGGDALLPVRLNHEVRFNGAARAVAGQDRAFVDIYLEGRDGCAAVGLDCQGRTVHGESGIAGNDANRLLGLQVMGVDEHLITPEQIREEHRYRQLVRYVAGKLGVTLRPKTPTQRERERQLVRDLFIDWCDLGKR